jgi:DNA-binding XRE family transcriptional regulator
MSPLLLNDDDVRARLDPATAVSAVRAALTASHAGTLHAPPRARADLGDGDLVFTAGRLDSLGVFGFRAYDTFAGADQLVAVWGREDGRLRVLVYGDELGAADRSHRRGRGRRRGQARAGTPGRLPRGQRERGGMSPGQPREPRTLRARLGIELHKLRRLTGLSGDALGRQLGLSQKTVSRIERGDSLPSLAQVTAWAGLPGWLLTGYPSWPGCSTRR